MGNVTCRGRTALSANVIGGSTLNWEDAVMFAGSVFTGSVAAWAEDQMLTQIKAFEEHGLTVRSVHGPCALFDCCAAQ